MKPPKPSAEARRWLRAKEIFQSAVDLKAHRRDAFVAAACSGDEALRDQVLRLLEGDGAEGGVLDEGGLDLGLRLLARRGEAPVEGQILGSYRLLERVGRGGMGEVYAGERIDGQFEQRVAVKLVRRGLDSPDIVRRFDAERRILGRLEHPFIAQIYDGGVAADGRPYLVMEFVEGLPIDGYCRQRDLPLAARLELFRRVLSAVQYAHQNLVIHRDLKPSNILITREGTPKLLDFGIAKLLDSAEAAQAATVTQRWQRRLTPDYASPEQFRGESITTASDVYSLGVVLYQLLTGRSPYRLEGRPPAAVERAVCEEPPVRPSAAAAPGHRRRLRGDLDNILLMALRKEPRRRYPSADRLSEDLRRHLEALPVRAREDTFVYRTSKFLRRHKGAAVFLLMLSAFGLAMTVQSLRLGRAYERTSTALSTAEVEGQKAEEVLAFLVGILEVADPRGSESEAVTVREVLREGSRRVRRELAEQPEVQATLMDTIGQVYLQLGLLDEAEPLFEESLETRRERLGGDHPDVATSLHHLGRLRRETGDWKAAEPLIEEALEVRRAVFGDDHLQVAESLNNLGLLYYHMGDYRRAEPALRQALEIRRRDLPEPHRQVAESLNNLGLLRFRTGDATGAEPLLRRAAQGYEASLGADHPDLAAALQNLALVLHRKGDPVEAEGVLRRVLTLQRRRLGEDHRDVADTLKNLGALLVRREAYEEAEGLLRQALEIHRQSLGGEHPDVAGDLNDLGVLLQAKGELAAAEPLLLGALELRRQVLPEGHPSLASSLVSLGSLRLDAGRPAEAVPLLREGLEIRREALPPGHWRIALAENVLGGALAEMGRWQEAGLLLAASYPVVEGRLGAGHRLARRARARLAGFCEAQGAQTQPRPCRELARSP